MNDGNDPFWLVSLRWLGASALAFGALFLVGSFLWDKCLEAYIFTVYMYNTDTVMLLAILFSLFLVGFPIFLLTLLARKRG